MKISKLLKALVLIAVAFAAVVVKGDLPRPAYSNDAMPYVVWVAKTGLMDHGVNVGMVYPFYVVITLVVVVFSVAVIICIRMRRFKTMLFCIIGCVLITGGIFLWCEGRIIIAETFGGGNVSNYMEPRDGETYEEYKKRVCRIKNNLCPVCDSRMRLVYSMGRHWVCDKCIARSEFKTWASGMAHGLTSFEKNILFRWQFFVCEKEGRRWYVEFAKNNNYDLANKFRDYIEDGNRQLQQVKHVSYEDFIQGDEDASVFLKNWHEKATDRGFEPSECDKELLQRALKCPERLGKSTGVHVHDSPSEYVYGMALGKNGRLSTIEVELCGQYDAADFAMVCSYINECKKGQHCINDIKSLVVSTDSPELQDCTFKLFSKMKIESMRVKSIEGSQRFGVSGFDTLEDSAIMQKFDLSALEVFQNLENVVLSHLHVTGKFDFEKLKHLRRFNAECCTFENKEFYREIRHRYQKDWGVTILLRSAVEADDAEDVRCLLGMGASAQSVWDDMPHYWGNASPETVQLLLDNVQELNKINYAKRCVATANLAHLVDNTNKDDANRVKLFKLLIGCGCNVNGEPTWGDSLLKRLVKKGSGISADDVEMLKALIGAGSYDFSRDKLSEHNIEALEGSANGLSFLALLLKTDLKVPVEEIHVTRFIKKAKKIDARTLEALDALLKRGVEVNFDRYTSAGTPLKYVLGDDFHTGEERYLLAKVLLKNGANPDETGKQGWHPKLPLEMAICDTKLGKDERLAMTKLLLEHGADPSRECSTGEKLVQKACDMEDGREFVELLKSHGHVVGNVSLCKVFTSQTDFADRKTIAELKMYLENGADANYKIDGYPLLNFAMARIKNGNMSSIKMLLEHGADPNGTDYYGKSSLVLAVEIGDEKAVRLLLEHGADPNAYGEHGRLALTAAIEGVVFGKCKLTMVQMLLDNGADPNLKMSLRGTPFSKALFYEQQDVIELLVKRGGDPNVEDAFGNRTLLSMVAKSGNLELVTLLLERGADVNSKGTFGDTVLSAAAEGGNVAVVKLLLEHGAQFGEKDRAGKILEKAVRVRNEEGTVALLKLLLDMGMGPVTDQAIIAAWWNKDARDFLLSNSNRSVDDFDVLDKGNMRAVRVKQPHAKEVYIKEMERRKKAMEYDEYIRKQHESRDDIAFGNRRRRGFSEHENDMLRRHREEEKKLDEAWLEFYSRQED